jgi:hypothetical protein
MENNVIVFKEEKIEAYDQFRAQLVQLKQSNEKTVFDYEDAQGNKEARSHIYKLRKTKTAVDKVRKDQKKDALEYGRRVDAQAKEIIEEIQSMIEVHQKPLDEIEEREKKRVEAHQNGLQYFHDILNRDHARLTSAQLKNELESLDKSKPDERYEEYTGQALSLYKEAREYLFRYLESTRKREEEQAELERLRAEKEERERQEREARIAQEAAEKARKEAEQKAKYEREESERRQMEAKQAAENAERARKEAEAKAKREAEEAEQRRIADIKATEERLKREAEEAKAKEIAEAKAREENTKHKAKINNEIKAKLLALGASGDLAKLIITEIAKGKINNVKIFY